jgi:hypothetical protein
MWRKSIVIQKEILCTLNFYAKEKLQIDFYHPLYYIFTTIFSIFCLDLKH